MATVDVDPEIRAIDEELTRRNLPRAALGRVLGLDSKQLTRLFTGRRRLQHAEGLAAKEWLWPGRGSGRAAGGAIVPLPGMVPLYSFSRDGRKLELSEVHLRAYVPMHPAQLNVVEAFAVEVPGVEMSPRYEPGEIAYISPYRWPPKGQDVLVMTNGGDAYLCRYVERDNEFVTLETLAPRRSFNLKLSELTHHAVVGRG